MEKKAFNSRLVSLLYLILILFFIILLGLVFTSGLVFAACTSINTPKIISSNYFELEEGKHFEYDFNLTNLDEANVQYAYAVIGDGLRGISLNKRGVISLTPFDSDVGTHKVAVIAVKEECSDTLIITLKIFDKPDIRIFEPASTYLQLSQVESINFKAIAVDRDENETLSYAWYLDSSLINDSQNKTNLTFTPGFNLSGVHELSVNVTDSRGLKGSRKWSLQISKVNRPPVLMFNIPNFMVFRNTATGAYNLNDYFRDPEGGILNYSYHQVMPQYELPGIRYADISLMLDNSGFVTYNPALDTKGYAYFVFTATDLLGLSTESNIVKVEIIGDEYFKNLNQTPFNDYCGDKVCSLLEDCKTCPFDCGECEGEQQTGCKPDWNCTEWSPCQPAGFQFRNCTDINQCGDNRTKPDELKRCEYTATCDDGLKNGIEEGVDCGGPCPPCPTCDDGVQNGGEEGVDCGGPCIKQCPSCDDKLQNQNESDIDCGGRCLPCPPGKKCFSPHDCESLRCEMGVCAYPTCDDNVRNQGEEGVDCGGPCSKLCGNCSDGIQNRGEEGVDCGGRCPPCPRCDDGLLNDDEKLIDCGGKCRPCGFKDYFKAYMTGFIIFLVLISIGPALIISYFVFLLTNLEHARKLYDNNASFGLLVTMNRFFRKLRRLRGKGAVITDTTAKTFIGELAAMAKKSDLTNKLLYDEIVKIYTALLSLADDFDHHAFITKLKSSGLPLFLKVLLAGYYKKAEILVMASYVAPEQRIDLIMELQFLLNEAAQG